MSNAITAQASKSPTLSSKQVQDQDQHRQVQANMIMENPVPTKMTIIVGKAVQLARSRGLTTILRNGYHLMLNVDANQTLCSLIDLFIHNYLI